MRTTLHEGSLDLPRTRKLSPALPDTRYYRHRTDLRRWFLCSACWRKRKSILSMTDIRLIDYFAHTAISFIYGHRSRTCAAPRPGCAGVKPLLDRACDAGAEVAIEPLTELRDATYYRYVGLDADATRIGDTVVWNV